MTLKEYSYFSPPWRWCLAVFFGQTHPLLSTHMTWLDSLLFSKQNLLLNFPNQWSRGELADFSLQFWSFYHLLVLWIVLPSFKWREPCKTFTTKLIRLQQGLDYMVGIEVVSFHHEVFALIWWILFLLQFFLLSKEISQLLRCPKV